MDYPTPKNPYNGKPHLMTDEVVRTLYAKCQASWKVDSEWLIGDHFIYWCHSNGRRMDDASAAEWLRLSDDGSNGETPSPDQIVVLGEICLAFPGDQRDLSRSWFEHYCGWIYATHPDGAERGIAAQRRMR